MQKIINLKDNKRLNIKLDASNKIYAMDYHGIYMHQVGYNEISQDTFVDFSDPHHVAMNLLKNDLPRLQNYCRKENLCYQSVIINDGWDWYGEFILYTSKHPLAKVLLNNAIDEIVDIIEGRVYTITLEEKNIYQNINNEDRLEFWDTLDTAKRVFFNDIEDNNEIIFFAKDVFADYEPEIH